MTILARATVVLGADITALNRKLSEAEQNVVDAGNRIANIGRQMSMKITLPIVGAGVVAFKEFGEQVEAMERVRGLITATGGAANVTADHIEELGDSLENTTTFADDVIQSAAGLLLIFKNVRNEAGKNNDIFDRTVRVAADMAATFGDDLPSTMQMLGRALQDPGEGLMMLQRRTRAFSDEQEAMIKRLSNAGRTLEAQKMVLDILNERFKDMAATMARTPLGQFKQMWNELGNVMEKIGQVVASILLPIINAIKRLANAFQTVSEDTIRWIVIIGAALAAIGPLVLIIGKLIALLPILGAGLSVGLAGTIGVAILAFGALVAAGVAVAAHWTWLKQQALALWTFIRDVFFSGIEFILDQLMELNTFTEMVPDWVKEWVPGAKMITGAMDAIGDAARRMKTQVVREHEDMLAGAGATLAKLEAEIMGTATVVKTGGGGGSTEPPKWLAGLLEISQELDDQLKHNARMEAALGDAFDQAAEDIKAYNTAIEKSIKLGVPLDQEKLKAWLAAMKQVESASESMALSWQIDMERIKSTIEKAKDPTKAFNEIVAQLQADVFAGVITWERYVEAMNAAKAAFDGVKSKMEELSEQIRQGFVDIAGRAVDDFVDSLFEAGKSLGQIIHQMITDIAKLIIKLLIMRALFGASGTGGLIGGLFGGAHARGGFIGAGKIGLVGEQGPELISGGRSGVTVTPMPAMNARGGGEGGITVPIQLNVSAMDSRDVTRLFQEQESVVATVVTQAVQKSLALRRMLNK